MFVALRNRNLLLLFLATVLMFVSFSVLMPTLPVFLRERGASHFLVGLIVGAFPVGVLVFRAVAGWLVSRIGRRKSLLAAAVLALAVPPAYGLFQTDGLLLLVRIVHGGLLSIFTTATLVVVTDVVRPERRGAAISEMGIANYIGIALGPAVAEAVYRPADLRGVLVTMGVSTALAVLVLRSLREAGAEVEESVDEPAPGGAWIRPGVVLASLVFFLAAVGHGAAFTFVPLLVKEYGLGASGPFFAVFALFTLLIRTLGKDLPDRYGRARMASLSLALFSATLVALAAAASQVWVLVAGAAYGVVFGIFQPALTALVADMTTYRSRGPVFGLFLAAFDGGFIVAGLVLGYVADLVGIRGMLGFSAAMPLLGALVLVATSRFVTRSAGAGRWREPGRRFRPLTELRLATGSA